MAQRTFLTLLIMLFLATIPVTLLADEPVWVDVRTTQEFDDGHVAQAVNIGYEAIGEGIGSVTTDKDALIYVYCRSGRRSEIAKNTLENLGYTRVINIGGLDEALTRANQELDR